MTLREPFKHARADVVVGLGRLDPGDPVLLASEPLIHFWTHRREDELESGG